MYKLVSAVGKYADQKSRWEKVDVSAMSLATIYQTFDKLFAIVYNDVLEQNINFDFDSIKATCYYSTLTPDQYFASIGAKALVGTDQYPSLKFGYVKYNDVFQAGFDVTPIYPDASATAQLPGSEKTAIVLTKSGVDYASIYNNCLFSVNGYLHLSDYDTNGVYVMDANKTRRTSSMNALGIYSFKDVGTIKQIPITENMVQKQDANVPYSTRAYIALSEDIGDRTVAVSIGGYLHMCDSNTIRQVSERLISFEFLNIPLYERILESIGKLDILSLGLTDYTYKNPALVDRAEVLSDDVLKKYMTLSQSFVILIDNADIYTGKEFVEITPFSGNYFTVGKPNKPLVGDRGKMLEYWAQYEDGIYCLSTRSCARNNFLFRTGMANSMKGLSDQRVPTDEQQKPGAHFLLIATDIAA